MKLRQSFLVALFAFFLFGMAPARAEEFAKPELPNIFKTLIRFGALDIRKDEIVDLYARIIECKIYLKHYRNDFRWQRVRQAIRQTIRQDVKTFPVGYKYNAVLQLDRYDFDTGIYSFTKKTAQARTNTFTIQTGDYDYCVREEVKAIPGVYRFILDEAVTMPGLPISQDEGKLLLQRMQENKNDDRLIYVSFNLNVVYIAPIAKIEKKDKIISAEKDDGSFGVMVAQDPDKGFADINVRLDSIEYFEDQERTKLIYVYRP